MDCGVLGQETIAIFRIIAKMENVTIDNDEYMIHYHHNWDVVASSSTSTATTTPLTTTTTLMSHGGYKVGQKKVVQFSHVYDEIRSYHVTLTATIMAPHLSFLHNVQHTANYTIAISENVCFTTTAIAQSYNETTTTSSPTKNIFDDDSNNNDNLVILPSSSKPTTTTIPVQNASTTTEDKGDEMSSSSSSFRTIATPYYHRYILLGVTGVMFLMP
jgi:hypothetical protein